jgi:hypothetical protein
VVEGVVDPLVRADEEGEWVEVVAACIGRAG